MSVARAMAQLPDLLAAAREAGLRTTVTLGTAFGCPFTGEIDPALVTDMAASIAAAAPDEIALADTIGVAGPTDVTERFAAIRSAIPAPPGCGRTSTTPGGPAWPTRPRLWRPG